jgi:hypothetical protein
MSSQAMFSKHMDWRLVVDRQSHKFLVQHGSEEFEWIGRSDRSPVVFKYILMSFDPRRIHSARTCGG